MCSYYKILDNTEGRVKNNYFADVETIFAMLNDGDYVGKVIVPEGVEIDRIGYDLNDLEEVSNTDSVYGFRLQDYVYSAERIEVVEIEKITLSKIRELIEMGAEVDIDGGYPLRNAISTHREEIAICLIEAGANVDIFDGAILHLAISENLENVVKKILKHSKNKSYGEDGTLVTFACENGNIEIIKELVEKGVINSSNICAGLIGTITSNRLEIIKYFKEMGLLEDTGCDGKVLRIASIIGSAEVLQYLLDVGFRVGQISDNVIMQVVKFGKIENMGILYRNGVNIEKIKDKAIDIIIQNNDIPMLEMLLSWGIEPTLSKRKLHDRAVTLCKKDIAEYIASLDIQ